MSQRPGERGGDCVSKNESSVHIGGAAQLHSLMVCRNFRLSASDECHPSGLQSSPSARLFRQSKLSNARLAVTIVDNSERKAVLEKCSSLRCLDVVTRLIAPSFAHKGSATVIDSAAYWYLLTRRNFSRSSSCFCRTVRSRS